MPRIARNKSSDYLYHIMSRSIFEVELFPTDEDKNYYLYLLLRYKLKFRCKIYAYCLMSNHLHFFIDPQGFDISKFMLCLNTAYVTYYNKKYKRYGHLFQGRFTSTVVSNESYAKRLSAYIHNNAKDISKYRDKEEEYPYSSYALYLGLRKDPKGLVDKEYILQLFNRDRKKAIKQYRSFLLLMKGIVSSEEIEEKTLESEKNIYRNTKSTITRYKDIKKLIDILQSKIKEPIFVQVRAKWIRECSDIRAFFVYVLRTLCDYTYAGICKYIGNMSQSGIVRLNNIGYELICGSKRYQELFESLIYT